MENNKRRSGKMVQLESGDKGIVYNDEKYYNGKAPVYMIDVETLQKTGKKVLCNPNKLKLIGFIN